MDITVFLNFIDEENRVGCLKMYAEHKERMQEAPGSLSKHQNWRGGYIHHLKQIMDEAISLHGRLASKYHIEFTLSDAILVLWLHDLEKPFRYVDPKREFVDG